MNTESTYNFSTYFQGKAKKCLSEMLHLAIKEDGIDLTSNGIFSPKDTSQAKIIARQPSVIAGLPIIPLFIELFCLTGSIEKNYSWQPLVQEGEYVTANTPIATIKGATRIILHTERSILNIIGHLSGIATLTKKYIIELDNTGITLLDTRKTLPGLRYIDKYAVLCGGGTNHRRNLEELLLIKDTHIDAIGSIKQAVTNLRKTYTPCPPIEVECRTINEVNEAIHCHVERIMLDNMPIKMLNEALQLIPHNIITEVSGGITLENIYTLTKTIKRKPNYISVGCITNSAPCSNFSMLIEKKYETTI